MPERVNVLGLAPHDLLRRKYIRESTRITEPKSNYFTAPLLLPFGWATKFSSLSAYLLWRRIQMTAHKLNSPLDYLVVTSPHYAKLLDRARGKIPTFYYCSDDYSQYHAWGGKSILQIEREITKRVHHTFFASQLLADRAISDYGLDASRVSVSPNATDGDFFISYPDAQRELGLSPPVVGVVGGVNSRLDFDFITQCAAVEEIGTLVLVGEIDGKISSQVGALVEHHPKLIAVGSQPHTLIPKWMASLDIALIPYCDSPMNRACSPMRLYDHLASGVPIIASKHCHQVHSFAEFIHIASDSGDATRLIRKILGNTENAQLSNRLNQLTFASQHTWENRARHLLSVMERYKSTSAKKSP
jgi:glycosyltransferase involved in cell wall biosynthesis